MSQESSTQSKFNQGRKRPTTLFQFKKKTVINKSNDNKKVIDPQPIRFY